MSSKMPKKFSELDRKTSVNKNYFYKNLCIRFRILLRRFIVRLYSILSKDVCGLSGFPTLTLFWTGGGGKFAPYPAVFLIQLRNR